MPRTTGSSPEHQLHGTSHQHIDTSHPIPPTAMANQPPVMKLSQSQSLIHVWKKPCIDLSFVKGF